MDIRAQQLSVLKRLTDRARNTAFGRKFDLENCRNYRDFANRVPLRLYKDLLADFERIQQNEADILWPGTTNNFAVSSGTSGTGKHLPLFADRLKSDRRFMRKVAFSYLKQRPNPIPLLGRHLSLPGSIEQQDGLLKGEISGFTAINVPSWLRIFQLEPPARLATLSFKDKFERLLSKALTSDIRIITAVPSWTLTLFQRALEQTGKSSIHELWPNLRLLVCGGVKLANYRLQLERLMGKLHPDFIETYGASEGYFAFGDNLGRDDLRLVIDNGIFYEFIPDPLPGEEALGIQEAVPAWEIKTGIPYAVLVTTNSGLWRYALKDIVEFTETNPPRIEIKGRVNEMLDDFGEAVYLYEAEEALKSAVKMLELDTGTFSIRPVLQSEKDLPYHHWYIQFFEPVHTHTLNRLGIQLDRHLQEINRHYAIRRASRAMGAPKVSSVSQSDINRWLESHGKDKAQAKLPKILPPDSRL